ncbi:MULTISPECIES: membrane protein insertion efficiency factor YidD [unclassified Gilliamella]|uniref:membrane protein insertion efficiency factor YidD n=1 Tax=unclassified Gilliamella TaxID=2685620 RepID=UPI002A13CFCF|nr:MULTISPECIES: membrane protein insertion efficiency factor YidD [unclassified Gilliamella]MCX8602378.1 membrane protein insertion efficiency factor YidD [Gilliamella sp. B3722]MCX8608193.1 membrane protein insertion efficiency factor YidD [Gilliamella sp. B3771]MCX8611664.1 membrane protein insertion efficiency factor YidD [Gilliamella sp. B3891]MCX8614096.1 membrane protein insertion efficiency factor YidD [Gilliamella sp. B3773]MCX8616180.1 membrane protein insertion efficiency factor Yid
MKWLNFKLIYLYRAIAPNRIRSACRFEPSCSEYALLAIEKYGVLKGWKMTLGRLMRCKPPNGGKDYP